MAIADALDFDVDEVLFDLAEHDGFPRKALEWAIANREAVTPGLLETVEAYVNGSDLDGDDGDAIFFVVHLLAQFREKRAYRPLMRLFSLDSARLYRILGDVTTETLPSIAISVFDGDPRPIQEVIENADSDDYVRSGLFEALAFLVKEGKIDLGEFKKYLLRAYADLRPQGESHVWVGWQSAISMLGLTGFTELVRKAFASGMIHPGTMRFHHFQGDVRAAVRDPESYKVSACVPLGYLDDAIGEMESWAAFSDGPSDRLEREPWEAAVSEFLTDEPHVNPFRDVGRNDPCPCGSGRKFKKCCLQ